MSLIPVLNSLPETSGVLGMDLPTLMDYKMGHIADIAKTQDFHDGIQLPAFVIFFSVLMVYKLRRNLNTITRLQLRTPRQKRTAGAR
ncbi:hypothetical protein NC651_008583 [Populus alba x Populus x berolinensis]|nr:hypothetical protein NC651_008583 [Populus alba x Populus x berolinensis]